MLDEGNDLNIETPPPSPTEGPESSNRTFLIVGGILAGLILVTLICFAAFFFFNPNRANTAATQTAISKANALQILNQTATAQATLWTQTPLPSPLATDTETPTPVTPTSSPTPVVALPSDTPVLADAALTATVAALQTQVAANLTVTVTPQTTAMPRTGFADQFGLPGLVILAIALVVVIFLARRLRGSPAH